MSRPAILYAVPPREGHMRPALQITAHLTSLGYDVTVLGTPRWQPAIEAVGARFSPCVGLWAIALDDITWWPEIISAPTTAARNAAQLDEGFTTLLPSGFQSVCLALMDIARRRAAAGDGVGGPLRIVVLSDTCLAGTLPLKLGTHLPPVYGLDDEDRVSIKTIGIGVVPVYWATAERPPWGSGLAFDDSEEGRRTTLKAHTDAWNQKMEDRGRNVLKMMACRPEKMDELLEPYNDESTGLRHPFWDASTVCHDVTLQFGLEALEFPTTAWPKHLKFAGLLPQKPLPEGLVYPDWWEELVVRNEAGRRIVFVAQGTEVLDHRELIVPTVEGLADRDDVLVIVVLCVRGGTLETSRFVDGVLPGNCRVLDYFPYDAVLPHADVFLSSSGFGGMTHAVAHGVPLVQTGRHFDKPDIGRRVEWSGLGVYLASEDGETMPSPRKVRDAVDRVVGDSRFKTRAEELRDEARRCDPLGAVEREVVRLSGI